MKMHYSWISMLIISEQARTCKSNFIGLPNFTLTIHRWGFTAHKVFLTFCFLTNIIVTAMLLLGGSAVVNAITEVNIYAASFLIPLGVIVYTLAGGLKATFLASYIHSVIGMHSNNQHD